MTGPLWTERYAPTVDELPQAHLRRYLHRVSGRPVNLLLYGPPGAGKTAAVRAVARETYADPETGLIELNVADFFDRTKREIADDERFGAFIPDRSWSKRRMIQHVFRELIAHAPIEGGFKTVLLDNAESVREDFQHALRRMIERHHRSTQFVLTTRGLGQVIPALRSRCLPVPVPAPDDAAVAARITTVLEAEDVAYEEAAIALLVEDAAGNLRRALLAAQTAHVASLRDDDGRLTEAAVYGTLTDIGDTEAFEAILRTATEGSFPDARSDLESLLIDDGLDGGEVLEGLLTAGRTTLDEDRAAALTRRAADVDFAMATGGRDRLQLSWLLSELPDIAGT